MVVLVRGGVGSLGRGQRLGNACKRILIKTPRHVFQLIPGHGSGGRDLERESKS